MLAISLSMRATRSDCSRAVCGELVAARGEVGERAGQFAEGLFRGADHASASAARASTPERRSALAAHLVAERLFFLGKLGERGFGVGDQRAFARDVLVELRQPAVEFGQALARAGFLGVERVAGDQQALQGGGGARFGFAERRHACAAASRPLPASAWAMVASATARTLKSLARSDSATSALAPSQRR